MEKAAEKIRRIKANFFELTIDRLVGERKDPSLRDAIRSRICQELGITNRYSMLLNNTVQPSMQEMLVFSQVLGVKMDELIQLED